MLAAPQTLWLRDPTSSDLNIEEKPHAFSWVFYPAQSQCLDCSTLPVMTVCILKPSQMKLSVTQVWGHAWIRSAVDFLSLKKEMRASQNASVPGILCRSKWEHPKWERHWEEKTGKLEQCLEANIPLRMNSGIFFEIASGIKSILFSPHERTMEVIRGGPFIITCEKKRQTGTAALLSNWGYKGQFDSMPAWEDQKGTCMNSSHWHRSLKKKEKCWLLWF